MKAKENLRTGFGLLRNYGWKKNLLAIAAGFLCSLALEFLPQLIPNTKIIARFDLAVAVLPLIGFLLGIWGILGCMLEYGGSLILVIAMDSTALMEYMSYLAYLIPLILYAALPSVLWYATPLKGEERATYPRLDTSAHVIKYYIIVAATLIVYVVGDFFSNGYALTRKYLLAEASMYTQCLVMALIVGMPSIILLNVIHHRTITINERMVLAFLVVGTVASVLVAFLIYRMAAQLDPDLFAAYERLMSDAYTEVLPADVALYDRFTTFWNWYMILLAVFQNVLLIVEIMFMRSIEKKITQPILHLSDALERYTSQEGGCLNPEPLKQECRPYRYGLGEVSSLTRTCVNMADEIDTYTHRLEQVTAEKQRIGTELDVASNIQRDMLPSVFPPFPDRNEIDLYASMTPAKEVGGDFYDYYFIDDDHLALTIADVSGKGVPAALFMMIAMTLLHNHAALGGSPREILTYVNHQLCQNNKSMMFCTVWLGILDLKTGKLTAANAGHEYPAVKRQGGRYELMMDEHDPAIGVRDGLRYREYELTLNRGDMLFQYTDGVTEATDSDLEMFGEERLVEALNLAPDGDPEATIRNIHVAIEGFVKQATQFDDITMLCVRYNGSDKSDGNRYSVKRAVPADVGRLDEVNAFIEEELEKIECPMNEMFNLTLVVEEVFVNIAHYAYDGRAGDAEIVFAFEKETRTVEMSFSDHGIPFDPTSRPAPDTTLRPEQRRIGGLGIHLVKQLMDEVRYEYQGGMNRLTVRKRL